MKKMAFFGIVLVLAGIFWTKVPASSLAVLSPQEPRAAADVRAAGDGITIDFSGWQYKEYVYGTGVSVDTIYAGCYNNSGQDIELEMSSTNQGAVQLTSGAAVTVEQGNTRLVPITYQVAGVGVSDLVVKVKGTDQEKRMPVYVMPQAVKVTDIVQTSFSGVTVKWEKVNGVSGYFIERAKMEQDMEFDGWWDVKEEYKRAATVNGADTVSVEVPAEIGIRYRYRVIGFVADQARQAYTDRYSYSSYQKEFMADRIKAQITSVTISGATDLTVTWKPMAGANAYKVWRSTVENGTYECVFTADAGMFSFTQQVGKGIAYYYKVTAVFPAGESGFSASVSRFIPKKGKAKNAAAGKLGLRNRNGQYGWNWAAPDEAFYYTAGGRLYAACVRGDKKILEIFRLSNSLKAKKVKKIKLSYDVWGGLYAGTDGNFYVAVGYHNYSESKEQTVIEIIKYNKNWKKEKTAVIKGGARNAFVGIYDPIHAGNLRMDMLGKMLYVTTARQMFQSSDGKRHQSDIAFWIDTETMTEDKEASHVYVSHSFNQFVKFKDGDLYLLDHGDAFPRSIALSIFTDYGLKTQKTAAAETSVFSLQGNTGDNFTGCRVGGMEVGGANVLVCGIAQPHDNPVKGISGFGADYKYNVFLSIYQKETGTVKVVWLTKNHPKNTSVEVGETRMVKISDDRFAILYSSTSKGRTILNYVVVNDAGEKVYSKKYSNMAFDGCTQPILYKGNIIWADTAGSYWNTDTRICSIPAVY